MRILHVGVMLLFAAACSPHSSSRGGTFTLASDVQLISSSAPPAPDSQTFSKMEYRGDYVVVHLREFFYYSADFFPPWLSLERNGRATLHVGTEHQLLSKRDEFIRDVTIRIGRSRLANGTALAVYNTDTAEVISEFVIAPTSSVPR